MTRFEVGVQSAVRREASLETALASFDALALDCVELAPAHLSRAPGTVPVDVTAGAGDGSEGTTALERSDVDVRGYGVIEVTDARTARQHLAVADRLGADYVTVARPGDDLVETLTGLAATHGVDVAVHPATVPAPGPATAPVSRDDASAASGAPSSADAVGSGPASANSVTGGMAEVVDVLERHPDDRLGLCFDLEAFVRGDVPPEVVLREHGDRILAVHLTDTSDLTLEDVPGTGRLHFDWLLAMLEEYAPHRPPLVVEHALPAEEPAADLQAAVLDVRAALLDLDG